MLLIDRQGEVTMSQAADYINVPMSTATGVVERLVKNGFLKRERSESDRRIVTIMLTDKGKKVVEDLKDVIHKYVKIIDDSLNDEERKLIFNIFTKLINALGKENIDETAEKQVSKINKIEID